MCITLKRVNRYFSFTACRWAVGRSFPGSQVVGFASNFVTLVLLVLRMVGIECLLDSRFNDGGRDTLLRGATNAPPIATRKVMVMSLGPSRNSAMAKRKEW